MEYSNDMQDAYKNIQEYNPGKKREVVIVFNDDVLMKRLNEKFINLIIEKIKLTLINWFISPRLKEIIQ